MYDFYPPPETHLGPVEETVESTRNGRNEEDVVVLTDEGVREAGVAQRVVDEIPTDPEILDDVSSNPSVGTVTEVARAIEDADLVVAVGGGSVMDTAKASTALPAFGDEFADLRTAEAGERPPNPDASVPLVLVPTTAGTGTETGHWAVISDHDVDEKISVGHPHLRADAVLLDPALTESLPPYVTASTGFDVLTQAIEAVTATGASALTQPYARYAFQLADWNLARAVEHGSDLDARQGMLEASYLAGLAMNNAGLGAVHGISHAIGGLYDTPHGHTNALLLPHVIRENARRSDTARTGYALLVDDTDDPGERLARRMEELLVQTGLDDELPGTPDNWDWDAVADRAVGNVNTRTNPASLDREDIVDLCRRAFE